MRSSLWAFLFGVLFAVGLGVGGMTQPERVLGFLDFTGNWDPTLMGFMGSAVVVFLGLYRLAQRRREPLVGGGWAVPPETRIDARLVGGAALFGLGWGLAGYCPGPVVASLGTGSAGVGVFVLAMGAGMALNGVFVRRRIAEPSGERDAVRSDASVPSCG